MVKEKVVGETKSERFKRLATARTNIILNRLRVLGNCANRSSYDYSADEINKIFDAIDRELKKQKNRFSGEEKTENFKL